MTLTPPVTQLFQEAFYCLDGALEPSLPPNSPSVAALGLFDGVHVGHRAILKAAVAEATALRFMPVALTFANAPQRVFQPTWRQALSSLPERCQQFKQCQMAGVWAPVFNEVLQHCSAQSFIEHALVGAMHVGHVCVGADFQFGYRRQGTVETLQQAGQQYGFGVTVVAPVVLDGQPVSSTRIRTALTAGDLALATRLLGRPYTLTGRVVHGKGRGAAIGYPTANLALPAEQQLPANGVYVVRVSMASCVYLGVANVGVSPTFGDVAEPQLEVHLLDYQNEQALLYGQNLQVSFLAYIRPEQPFASVEALCETIAHDVAYVRQYTA